MPHASLTRAVILSQAACKRGLCDTYGSTYAANPMHPRSRTARVDERSPESYDCACDCRLPATAHTQRRQSHMVDRASSQVPGHGADSFDTSAQVPGVLRGHDDSKATTHSKPHDGGRHPG